MKKLRRRKKSSKNLLMVALLCLLMGTTAALTLALLTAQSEDKENVFTGASGLKVEVEEPKWESPGPDATPGKEIAENYSPDDMIPKDPYLQNTSTVKTGHENDSKEYVAIRLTYQINANQTGSGDPKWETVTYEKFTKLAKVYHKETTTDTEGFNIGTEATKWTAKTDSGNTIFYYNSMLPGGAASATDNKTSNLFDTVKIDPTLEENTYFDCGTSGHYTAVSGNTSASGNHKGLIGFRIVVEGFAVQAYQNNADIGLDGDDGAKKKLDALMGANPAPTDSPVSP